MVGAVNPIRDPSDQRKADPMNSERYRAPLALRRVYKANAICPEQIRAKINSN